jgi:uncharacterized membrane protein
MPNQSKENYFKSIFKKIGSTLFDTFWIGISFLLPIAVVGFIFWRIFLALFEFMVPTLEKIGESFGFYYFKVGLGLMTLFLIIFLVGALLRLHLLKEFLTRFENKLLFYVPGFKFYQSLMNSPLEHQEKRMKPCLLKEDGILKVCFLVEKNEKWATVMIPEAPSFTTGEIVIIPLEKLSFIPMSNFKVTGMIRNYGEGILKVLEKNEGYLPDL